MNVLQTDILSSGTKEQIIETTINLVAELGFHGMSMSMLSKESNIAIGTIYHHFKSKDDLIVEALQFAKRQAMSVSFGRDDKSLDYYNRFMFLWKNLYEYHITHPAMLSFITQFFSSPYWELCGNDNICFQTEFGLFIADAKRNGCVKEISPNIISSIFLGSIINCAKQQNRSGKRLKETEIESLVTIIWNGIKNTNL